MEELRAVTLPILQPVLMKYLPYSSDAAILRFARNMVDQLRAIQSKSSPLCLAHLAGTNQGKSAEAYRLVPDKLRTEELETYTDIMESGDLQRKIPTEAEVQNEIQLAVQDAAKKVGDDLQVLSDINQPSVNPAKACNAYIALYSSIASLPPSQAAKVLRYMFTQK